MSEKKTNIKTPTIIKSTKTREQKKNRIEKLQQSLL